MAKRLVKTNPLAFTRKTGEEIYLLSGRFGAYVQIGKTPPKQKKVKGKKKVEEVKSTAREPTSKNET
jgi:topoisomerase IA-like protein